MVHMLSIHKRIYLLVGLMVLSLITLGAICWFGISRIIDASVFKAQEAMIEDQREKVSLLVGTMAESLGQGIKEETSEERRRHIIRQAISSIRFEQDGSGYFFVYDFSGVNVVHPLRQDFEGTNRLDAKDPNGKEYVRELMEKAHDGGGFVEYAFNKPNQKIVSKLATARPIEGTDMWIATGMYTDNIDTRMEAIAQHIRGITWHLAAYTLGSALLLMVAVVLPLSRRIGKSIIGPLERTTSAAQAIAEGDYSIHLNVESKGEFGIMAQAFNDMIAKVRGYKEHLESLVEQRTAELRENVSKLESANERIMESILYARTIQQAILPSSMNISSHVKEFFIIWKPKDVIGGDLFWFTGPHDGFLIAVMDCTGHGVPGALMTMLASTTLSRVVNEIGPSDPAQVLKYLNTYVRQTLSQHKDESDTNDGLDIGICFVEPQANRLTFAGARISLIAFNGEPRVITGDKSSVGYKSPRPDFDFTNTVIETSPGMCFYMHTDGLSDQVGGEKNLPLGKRRLRGILQEVQGEPMSRQKESITRCFKEYMGDNDQRDDVTLFGFRLQ